MKDFILQSFTESAELKTRFIQTYLDVVIIVAKEFVHTFRSGKKLLVFGNGGSAADAQHIAGELVSRFKFDRPALPALSLVTDTSIITAIGNDADYSQIFARQVEALGQEGDIALAISTSGNSLNVLRGIEIARKKKLKTVAFTGKDGGKLAPLVDYALIVPSQETPRIQEVHLTLAHVLCEIVEKELFPL
jgi:D-sedoheptulose 7-phosphate isomerase